MTASRRRFLRLIVAGSIAAIALASPHLIARIRRDRMAFEPVPGHPGYRRLAAGPMSGANPVLIGVETPIDPAGATDLCAGLYGPSQAGTVPAAVFTDAFCPHCVPVDRMLMARSGTTLAVQIHHLPRLGPASVWAARAILAAPDRADAFRARFERSLAVIDKTRIVEIGGQLGLDPETFADDLMSPKIDAELARSEALARSLGVVGTPTAVIGQTLIQGQFSERVLEQIIKEEARRPESFC
ncbi:MAG: DsbA family protein [Pseudomonadota bacterium]